MRKPVLEIAAMMPEVIVLFKRRDRANVNGMRSQLTALLVTISAV